MNRDATVDQIIATYEAGASLRQTAAAHGKSYEHVRTVLLAAGVRPRPGRPGAEPGFRPLQPLTEEQRAEILEKAAAGKKASKIARALRLPADQVRAVLAYWRLTPA